MGGSDQPSWILLPQMRTAIRVFIQKVPCKRAQSPALGAPHSPVALHHLLDLQKGSLRRLSPHSWAKSEVGPCASQGLSPLNPALSRVEPARYPYTCPTCCLRGSS
jgi:hypothetical protein